MTTAPNNDWITESLLRARTLRDGTVMSDERLQEVFDLVKNPEAWKEEIDTVFDPEEVSIEEIETAVAWYTGGLAECWEEDGVWHVYSSGYYANIGS